MAPKDESSTRGASTPAGTDTRSHPNIVKVFSLGASTRQYEDDGVVNIRGMAVTTLKFPEADAHALTLQKVRSEIVRSLKSAVPFKFCTDDCSVVATENITLDAYHKMFQRPPKNQDKYQSVCIAAAPPSPAKQASALSGGNFLLKFVQMSGGQGEGLSVGSLHASSFKGQNPSAMPLGELRKLIGKMSSDPGTHAFCSRNGTAAGDDLSLQQYLALDNEQVHAGDGTPNVVVRYRLADARVPAEPSKARSAAASDSIASKFHGASQEVKDAMEQMKFDGSFQDRSADEKHIDRTAFRVEEQLRASDFAARDANPLKYTSRMDDEDWDSVLRNCCLLYGWKLNTKTGQIERAATPAFRLRKKVTGIPDPDATEPPSEDNNVSESSPAKTEEETPKEGEHAAKEKPVSKLEEREGSAPKKLPVLNAKDVVAKLPSKPGAIPSYAINDQSRIAITVVSSEFQESMARNHFSSSTIETGLSGGFNGYSIGITGGNASERSSAVVDETNKYSKKMVANYMFPRVTVFLRPEDLEPTEELRQQLLQVKKTLEINQLRQLYGTFGQFFCYSATLGGCLQTGKVVDGDKVKADSASKEKFKSEVGVAFSTPIGIGANFKSSKENATSQENLRETTKTSESLTFEATGGNTILAADPSAWSGSVADFNNWRVVERGELSPMVDTLAQIPGFREVRTWFLSASSKLNEYIVVPERRVLHVRFKVAAQNDAFQRITGRKTQAYLAHDPEYPQMPVRTRMTDLPPTASQLQSLVKGKGPFGPEIDITTIIAQPKVTTSDALFYPYCTQAPVLMFPEGIAIGTGGDTSLSHTVWRLEIAKGYALGHDTLVCIKSTSLRGSALSALKLADADKNKVADLSLVVYRNAQGVFMPAISSSDEPCYWRLQPVGKPEASRHGDRHRHGDTLRLTWSFADQAGAGFRDYLDDIYGRRCFGRPADLPSSAGDTLCLKLPFPRPEGPDSRGIGLFMSPALTEAPIIGVYPILSIPSDQGAEATCTFNLHDLTFRIDVVGNDGRGDADDFMNIATSSRKDKLDYKVLAEFKTRVNPAEEALKAAGPLGTLVGGLVGGAASLFAPLAGPTQSIISMASQN